MTSALTSTNGKNGRRVGCRGVIDKPWIILAVATLFVFLSTLYSSSRLSSLSDDRQNVHLEDFLRGIDTEAKTAGTLQGSQNSFVDPYFVADVPPSDGTNLWDDDQALPEWAKAYFNWHKHKRTTWNLGNYTSERWLIMQCLADQDERKCGGTADRLKPVPFMLRMAYNTHRVLLIRWTRPGMLEEFLVPPGGGFDWRVPQEMAAVMSNETNGKRLVAGRLIASHAGGGMPLIRTRFQSFNGGSAWYNNQTTLDHQSDELKFDDIFHKIWRIFFRPSVAFAQKIEEQLDKMKLVPGDYASAHLRALYAVQHRDEYQIHKWTANSLKCASQLRLGMPIFFASDSDKAAEYAKVYGSNHSARVETHTPNPNPPLHLDKCTDWKRQPISDFYDTFVDLYLLSLGGCVTFNKGGFGHWGLLIGGEPQCKIDVRDIEEEDKCRWSAEEAKPIPDSDIPYMLFPKQ